MGEYRINNEKNAEEELAVNKAVEILNRITKNQINYAFRQTGLAKFKNAEVESLEVGREEILEESQEKLEELHILETEQNSDIEINEAIEIPAKKIKKTNKNFRIFLPKID